MTNQKKKKDNLNKLPKNSTLQIFFKPSDETFGEYVP